VGLLKALGALFSGRADPAAETCSRYYYVRCHRCHEIIRARIDLRNELSPEYGEGLKATGYTYCKVLIGSKRCFQPIEVTMTFDGRHNMLSCQVAGGDLVGEEEYRQSLETDSPSG